MPGTARITGLAAALFTDDGVVGKGVRQSMHDGCLGTCVELGHEIRLAGLEVKFGALAPAFEQDGRSGGRCSLGDGQLV